MQSKEVVNDIEIWKDIKGYENIYKVSNLGRIKSLEREVVNKDNILIKRMLSEKIMSLTITKKGYLRVTLINENGKRKSLQVHRIVADTFIENKENKPQVNHINCVKTYNRVENLEWVNNSENIKHAYDNNKISRPMSKMVINTKTKKTYKTIHDASKDSEYCQSYISQMLNGVRYNRTNFKFI